MKKGIYVVGDLCYLFTDKKWDELCNTVLDDKCGEFTLDGEVCWWNTTEYGDGYYPFGVCETSIKNNVRFEGFPVDAGLIGIVPLELLNKDYFKISSEEILNSTSNMVIIINRDFDPRFENGTFIIGDLDIYTKEEDEDEDEDEFSERDED